MTIEWVAILLMLVVMAILAAVIVRMVQQSERRPESLATPNAPSSPNIEAASAGIEERDDAERRRAAIEKRWAEFEAEAKRRVDERIKDAVATALGRLDARSIVDESTDTFELPGDDFKGRIVGRDGRNLKAFERATGVDLLIDEQPGAVVVSSFDGARRAIARRALEILVQSGKFQPAKIEEAAAQAARQVEEETLEAGRSAAKAAGIAMPAPKVLEAMGRLRFRHSLGQNVLEHSIETALIAAHLAAELGFDAESCRRAGFFHDLGKGLAESSSEPHALAGMRFLASCGEREPVLNAVGAHHREIVPTGAVSEIVIVADALSATRPGARSEALDQWLGRVERIEQLALAVPGVRQAYAVQSGRELRVAVAPEELDDLASRDLADRLARQICELEPQHSLLKVVVLREARFEADSRTS